VGRGYLWGVGALLAMVFAAQVVATLGYGRFFPWAVPALLSGMAGPDQAGPGALGVLLVVGVTAVSCWALVQWWERADHAR
jgi:ABC-2 type transport system permease protein